jgi:transcriptional regulator with XRE-family HTH domain
MNNLRKLIVKSKFRTQEKFASSTGINESLLSKYCRGLRAPSKGHSKIIEQALGQKIHIDKPKKVEVQNLTGRRGL